MGNCCFPRNITVKTCKKFVPNIKTGKVIKVYDGDTITIGTRLSLFGPWYKFSVRLPRIDAPEMKEKPYGKQSGDILRDLILHKKVKLVDVGYDKYGRILAEVYLLQWSKNINISDWMLVNKLAVPYYGGSKTENNWGEINPMVFKKE